MFAYLILEVQKVEFFIITRSVCGFTGAQPGLSRGHFCRLEALRNTDARVLVTECDTSHNDGITRAADLRIAGCACQCADTAKVALPLSVVTEGDRFLAPQSWWPLRRSCLRPLCFFQQATSTTALRCTGACRGTRLSLIKFLACLHRVANNSEVRFRLFIRCCWADDVPAVRGWRVYSRKKLCAE